MVSMSITLRPVSPRATARLAPTMPPPTMTTSKELAFGEMMPGASTGAARAEFVPLCAAAPARAESGSSGTAHHRLDLVGVLRGSCSEYLMAGAGDDDVVFDADADAAEALRNAARARRDVDARLDRHG